MSDTMYLTTVTPILVTDNPWQANSYSGGNTAQSLQASIENEIAKFPFDPESDQNAMLYTYDLSGGGATSEFMFELVLVKQEFLQPEIPLVPLGLFKPIVFMDDSHAGLSEQVNRYLGVTLVEELEAQGPGALAAFIPSTAIAGAGPVYCWVGLIAIEEIEGLAAASGASRVSRIMPAHFVRPKPERED